MVRGSERESRLQIDAAVQAALRKSPDAARQIVRFAKQRRCDDAVDGPGIHVIEQVTRLHRYRQVIALACGSAAQSPEESAGTTAWTSREAAAGPATTWSSASTAPAISTTTAEILVVVGAGRTLARSAKTERLGDAEVEVNAPGASAEVARQNISARPRVDVETRIVR